MNMFTACRMGSTPPIRWRQPSGTPRGGWRPNWPTPVPAPRWPRWRQRSELSAATNAALQEAVDRARTAGRSWREIGDVLDTTRQAAFQRFGRPVDPRTGKPMLRAVPRGTADRAIDLFANIIGGRWEAATRDFTPQMREHVDAGRIADAYAQTVSMVGGFERMGEALAYPVSMGASVDIPLHFEAGERTGQVTFDRNGKVIGLFIRPPQS